MTRILSTRPQPWIRHPIGPRRADRRAACRRGDDPDLPDVDLRAGGPGTAPRLRVRPDPESHPRGAGAQRCEPRRSLARPGLRLRPGGARRGAQAAPLGRPRRLRRQRLRRHPAADGAGVRRAGAPLHLRRHARPGERRARADARDPAGLLRDAHQSDDEPGGPGRGGRPDPGAWVPVRGGQHLRHAVLPAAAAVRRRHRAPLHDQVPQRAQRHGRAACW